MRKSNKKVLKGIAVGAIATLALVELGVEVYSYATLLNEKTAEKIITEVWEENKEEITDTLNLQRLPELKLEYTCNDNSLMYVQTLFTTKGRFYARTITKSQSDYIVHICVPNLIKHINKILKRSLRKRKQVTKSTIKFLFCHELRHIWQAETGFMVGKPYQDMDISFLNGHGEKEEEKDANEFGVIMASNTMERKLFTLLKLNQELATKFCLNAEEIKTLKEAEAEYCACL